MDFGVRYISDLIFPCLSRAEGIKRHQKFALIIFHFPIEGKIASKLCFWKIRLQVLHHIHVKTSVSEQEQGMKKIFTLSK